MATIENILSSASAFLVKSIYMYQSHFLHMVADSQNSALSEVMHLNDLTHIHVIVHCAHISHIVQFQKISILPPQKGWDLLGGGGGVVQ